VQLVPTLPQQAAVRDFVRERMLECVCQIRKEPRLVKEFRGLQVSHLGAYLGPQAIDPRGQDSLHGGGDS
jgi:hypothetical protein